MEKVKYMLYITKKVLHFRNYVTRMEEKYTEK